MQLLRLRIEPLEQVLGTFPKLSRIASVTRGAGGDLEGDWKDREDHADHEGDREIHEGDQEDREDGREDYEGDHGKHEDHEGIRQGHD